MFPLTMRKGQIAQGVVVALVLLLTFAVAACGSGGGGGHHKRRSTPPDLTLALGVPKAATVPASGVTVFTLSIPTTASTEGPTPQFYQPNNYTISLTNTASDLLWDVYASNPPTIATHLGECNTGVTGNETCYADLLAGATHSVAVLEQDNVAGSFQIQVDSGTVGGAEAANTFSTIGLTMGVQYSGALTSGDGVILTFTPTVTDSVSISLWSGIGDMTWSLFASGTNPYAPLLYCDDAHGDGGTEARQTAFDLTQGAAYYLYVEDIGTADSFTMTVNSP